MTANNSDKTAPDRDTCLFQSGYALGYKDGYDKSKREFVEEVRKLLERALVK